MSNILASIGLGQMQTIDETILKTREIFKKYQNSFREYNDIEFMPSLIDSKSTNWLTVMLIKNINYKEVKNLIKRLDEKNIETRPIWKPMHLQPLFKNYDYVSNNNDNVTEYLFNHGLCLPSGPSLKNNDQEKIIELIKNYIGL